MFLQLQLETVTVHHLVYFPIQMKPTLDLLVIAVKVTACINIIIKNTLIRTLDNLLSF